MSPFFISALSDSQSNFLLNGNFVVAMFKREITFKGAVIEYSGSDTKVERINCTDRIDGELILQVLTFSFLYSHLVSLISQFNETMCLCAYRCCYRFCVWETFTARMCVTPLTYPLRRTGSGLCGIPQAPGLSAIVSVRVRFWLTFQSFSHNE